MSMQLRLSELLIAKFSHDIAGQIGAINNGIEFLYNQDNEIEEKAVQLIKVSSEELVSRLEFFRYAYGYIKTSGEPNIESVNKVIENFCKHKNIKFQFVAKNLNNCVFKRSVGKLIALICLILTTSLIYGGIIKMEIDGQNFTITGSGDKIKNIDDVNQILNGDIELELQNVHIYLMKIVAKDMQIDLNFASSESSVVFTFVNGELYG